MTFSILATDGLGTFGMAVASSSPAVAARCIHLRPGVGGVASQNITNPDLGTQLLDLLEAGRSASEALDTTMDSLPNAEYRQIMVLDTHARTSHFSGKQILGVYNSAESPGSIAAGNLLRTAEVPQAMVDAFQGTSGELETRLLRGLQAGLQVGGETGPVHSAGLATVRSVPWRDTDLRVDWAERAPIAQLADLVERWLPQRDAYVTRAIDPASAPSYGVPGDD